MDTYVNPAGNVSVTLPAKPTPSISILTINVPPGSTDVESKDRVALGSVCAATGDELDMSVKPPATLSSNAAKINSLFKASLLYLVS